MSLQLVFDPCLLADGLACCCGSLSATGLQSQGVHHIVMFNFKQGTSADQLAKLQKSLLLGPA